MPELNGQEKTEQATGKKINDSRDKGEVAKSLELNSLSIFTTGLLLLFLTREYIGDKLKYLSIYTFSSLDRLELNLNILRIYAAKGILFFVVTIFPVFLGLVIIAIVVGYGQVGFRITPKALTPKFNKLDPIKGIKNSFFSSKPFVELFKSLLKIIVVGFVSYIILKDMILDSVGLVDYSIAEIVNYMLSNSIEFLWKVALIYAIIAFSDFAYQRYKHKKGLMMTKQEVKEEHKQTDGDPLIKSQIKGKQMEMARKRMMQNVSEADVVITNPTHYAVALKYDIAKNSAPKVIAKGMDLVAQKIKKIARENNIPLHEDVQLARALYKSCDVGDVIPDKLFKTVAQILAYIFQLKQEKRKKSILK